MVLTRSQEVPITDSDQSPSGPMPTSTEDSAITAATVVERRFNDLQQLLQQQITSQCEQMLDVIQQKLATLAMPLAPTSGLTIDGRQTLNSAAQLATATASGPFVPAASALRARNSSPARDSATSEHHSLDLLTTDPFRDIHLDILQMNHTHLDSEHTRQQANVNQQQLMRKLQFNIRTEGKKFRWFIKKFVRVYNSARSDMEDAPAIFLAALHDDTVTWLQRMRCDLTNVDAMVQMLAV